MNNISRARAELTCDSGPGDDLVLVRREEVFRSDLEIHIEAERSP